MTAATIIDRTSAVSHGVAGEARGRQLALLGLTALGVVFGDIGTSPLYAVRECFNGEHGVPVTEANVLGVMSLIFWALTIVISVKYMLYVMRADNGGEGGILALMALSVRSPGLGARRRAVVLGLGLFGAALLYGDAMITPSISVLSAMEGLELVTPALHRFIIPATLGILVVLFLLQRRGTGKIGRIFGPVTLLWFFVLALLGIASISQAPRVLLAVAPSHAVFFLLENRMLGFIVVGTVFLVVTGGEALYADMGHFGLRPIRMTWFAVVMPALLLNYFGQGALLLTDASAAENPFFRLAPAWALIPLVALATLATIIASQAVIAGVFSLTRQAIMLGFWPRLRILHTSASTIGQIYVPTANWILMLATIGLVLGFRSSSNLAAAYGVAVTTTMVITTLLAYVVATHRWRWPTALALTVTLALLVPDLAFFSANMLKFVNGGWFPLLVATVAMLFMTTWQRGRYILRERIEAQLVPLEDFFELMRIERAIRVPGTAIFLTSSTSGTPPALMHSLMHNHIVHKAVVLLTIVTEDEAHVPDKHRVEIERLPEGFVRVVAHYGFMEHPDVPTLLEREDTPTPPIQHTTFFLGRENVLPKGRHGMQTWRERIFAAMSRNALGASRFFGVPPDRVLEVGAQIEI